LMECKPRHNTTDVATLWAGMPGNAGFSEWSFYFYRTCALFFTEETNYKSSPSPLESRWPTDWQENPFIWIFRFAHEALNSWTMDKESHFTNHGDIRARRACAVGGYG
jgi:hypothetical protein